MGLKRSEASFMALHLLRGASQKPRVRRCLKPHVCGIPLPPTCWREHHCFNPSCLLPKLEIHCTNHWKMRQVSPKLTHTLKSAKISLKTSSEFSNGQGGGFPCYLPPTRYPQNPTFGPKGSVLTSYSLFFSQQQKEKRLEKKKSVQWGCPGQTEVLSAWTASGVGVMAKQRCNSPSSTL